MSRFTDLFQESEPPVVEQPVQEVVEIPVQEVPSVLEKKAISSTKTTKKKGHS